jgi:hypothetical protein
MAQQVGDQSVEALCVFGNDLQEIRVGPGDTMTFEHIRKFQNPFPEPGVVSRVLDANTYECGNVFTESLPIHACGVPGDDAFLLELTHSLGHRGLRESHGRSHLELSHPRILLQEIEELIIYRIKCHITKLIQANQQDCL